MWFFGGYPKVAPVVYSDTAAYNEKHKLLVKTVCRSHLNDCQYWEGFAYLSLNSTLAWGAPEIMRENENDDQYLPNGTTNEDEE